MKSNTSFFSTFATHLSSKREIVYEKLENEFKIIFFLCPQKELKEHWPMVLFVTIGFGIFPFYGFYGVLNELLQGYEENVYAQAYMYFLLFFFLMPPTFVYLKLIKPIFTVRTVICNSSNITIQDSYLESNPKVRLAVTTKHIKRIEWKNSSFFERINQQENNKLYLVHNSGQIEIISTYPQNDLTNIKNILEEYLGTEEIKNTEKILSKSIKGQKTKKNESYFENSYDKNSSSFDFIQLIGPLFFIPIVILMIFPEIIENFVGKEILNLIRRDTLCEFE